MSHYKDKDYNKGKWKSKTKIGLLSRQQWTKLRQRQTLAKKMSKIHTKLNLYKTEQDQKRNADQSQAYWEKGKTKTETKVTEID